MFAIVEVGGKQVGVKKGDIIDVEKLAVEDGTSVSLDKVLLISKDGDCKVGQPYLLGAKVTVVVLSQEKAKKVISYKYRRRKSSHWKKGHRQQLTRLEIKEIEFS